MNTQKMILRVGVLFSLFLLNTNSTFGQLDSVSVNAYMSQETDPIDSSSIVDVLKVETTVNDISDLMDVVVVVCDYSSGNTLTLEKLSKQQYVNSGNLTGQTCTNTIFYMDPLSSYIIKVRVVRLDGACLKETVFSLTNQN